MYTIYAHRSSRSYLRTQLNVQCSICSDENKWSLTAFNWSKTAYWFFCKQEFHTSPVLTLTYVYSNKLLTHNMDKHVCTSKAIGTSHNRNKTESVFHHFHHYFLFVWNDTLPSYRKYFASCLCWLYYFESPNKDRFVYKWSRGRPFYSLKKTKSYKIYTWQCETHVIPLLIRTFLIVCVIS